MPRCSPLLALLLVTATPVARAQALAPVAIVDVRPANLSDLRAEGQFPRFSRPPSDREYNYGPGRPAEAAARTSVDHQFAPGGLFGQLGYFCLSDDPAEETHLVGVMAGSQDGRIVGGTLRYPFK